MSKQNYLMKIGELATHQREYLRQNIGRAELEHIDHLIYNYELNFSDCREHNRILRDKVNGALDILNEIAEVKAHPEDWY